MTKKKSENTDIEKLIGLSRAVRELAHVVVSRKNENSDSDSYSPPQDVMESVHNLTKTIDEEVNEYRRNQGLKPIDSTHRPLDIFLPATIKKSKK